MCARGGSHVAKASILVCVSAPPLFLLRRNGWMVACVSFRLCTLPLSCFLFLGGWRTCLCPSPWISLCLCVFISLLLLIQIDLSLKFVFQVYGGEIFFSFFFTRQSILEVDILCPELRPDNAAFKLSNSFDGNNSIHLISLS